MKPSLPQLCHRQTSSPLKTHACLPFDARTHAHLGMISLATFQLNFSILWVGTWADCMTDCCLNLPLPLCSSVFQTQRLILSGGWCETQAVRWREELSLFCCVLLCSDRCTGLCKWQPEPEDVCWLPRGLLQPAGEVSVAPYGAGKINNERKFSRTAGGLLVSPPNKI